MKDSSRPLKMSALFTYNTHMEEIPQ